MKLTGWFSQDKIADNSRVQTPNNANTEQVNRQIRALVPGQTLRGEVVSREGNNAQIRLLQDVLVDAKVDADIRLELGQNITFQVKNNGQTLNLSPLFTNMATEGTVLKALDMALLPVNENTVAMTKQLMDAGLPIDKNTLQQIWHESNAFPDAEILDLVNLHRLELPVTEENITQMASYRNLKFINDENPLQRSRMPCFVEFVQADFKLHFQQLAGMLRRTAQDLAHPQEMGFVIADHAGIRGDRHFAVRKSVERVDGLVRRLVGRDLHDDFDLLGRIVVHLAVWACAVWRI